MSYGAKRPCLVYTYQHHPIMQVSAQQQQVQCSLTCIARTLVYSFDFCSFVGLQHADVTVNE